MPATWIKFLGKKPKKWKGKVMPERTFHTLILQVYQEKITADKNAVSENTPLQPMPEFVINFMLFKFGTRKLVQQRINRYVDARNVWVRAPSLT